MLIRAPQRHARFRFQVPHDPTNRTLLGSEHEVDVVGKDRTGMDRVASLVRRKRESFADDGNLIVPEVHRRVL